jgi:uncharacterized membrane protein YesL
MLKRQQMAGPSACDTVSHHTPAMIFFFGTSVWSMVKTTSEMNAYKLTALLNKWESCKILMQK